MRPVVNARSDGEDYKYGECEITRASMAAILSSAANFELVCIWRLFLSTPKTFPLPSLPQTDTFTRQSCIRHENV
jgi:hypothetical protein